MSYTTDGRQFKTKREADEAQAVIDRQYRSSCDAVLARCHELQSLGYSHREAYRKAVSEAWHGQDEEQETDPRCDAALANLDRLGI